MTYNTTEYYSTADYELVRNAHQALVRRYRAEELDTTEWYWKAATQASSQDEHHIESVGPFTLHSGPLKSLPAPLVGTYLDSQIKAYMDRDALGDAVREGVYTSDEHKPDATREARETEVAKRIGGRGLSLDVQMAMVEYGGYVLGGIVVSPGERDETVATIMESSERATSISALQAKFRLPPDDPFLTKRENELVDLVKYFRAPDHALRRILPAPLLEKKAYRKTVHLVRALTISEAFALTERWAARRGRAITTGVCETPNDDVRALIEGRRVRSLEGQEIRLGAIPHRILTSSTGAELYPAAYQGRSEGQSKIYTLYAFDFAEIASRSQEYRRLAIAAYNSGSGSEASADSPSRAVAYSG
jgi:hypothetical protein